MGNTNHSKADRESRAIVPWQGSEYRIYVTPEQEHKTSSVAAFLSHKHLAARSLCQDPLIGMVGRRPLIRRERHADRGSSKRREKGLANRRSINAQMRDPCMLGGGTHRLLALDASR
jgi:hypothetical protein